MVWDQSERLSDTYIACLLSSFLTNMHMALARQILYPVHCTRARVIVKVQTHEAAEFLDSPAFF